MTTASLWGEEFTIKDSPKQSKKLINKISKAQSATTVINKTLSSKGVSLDIKLRLIRQEVERILGKYKENTIVIRDYDTLVEYFDKAIENDEIAIDTETNNSLDPLTCKLMGPCLYTPGMKNAYIPMHHTNFGDVLLDNQLTEEQFKEQLERLKQNNVKIIMHNGKFDYKVIKCTCDIELDIYWDTMIAAKILDENEKRAGLKYQYIDKIDSAQEKYDIEHLFEGVEYQYVEPELFALYAATDSFMTYELYKWQKNKFEQEKDNKLYDLFMNIEMPVIKVAAEMELTGICIDTEYAKRLSNKYHKLINEVDKKIDDELNKYAVKIAEWRTTKEANFKPISETKNKKGEVVFKKSKNEQLKSPPVLSSPTQLAILLYDILNVPVVDKDTPRGTGEDILLKLNLPICKLILEKRGIEKLLNTYIDKLPECINKKDNRLHANFNQIGAGTGRFSSSEPNLQNIPSHEKAIRMMFTASDGYLLVGADFSQQEPRLLSQYSMDENMIGAYKKNKDLYATIASGVYKNNYWDNMEHKEDGSPNPEGKKRRSNCKSLLLGIMYGRGAASIAEQIGSSIEEAQRIVNDFYKSFPKVKDWINETEKNAKKNGYVEDFWGRRRRLPDIQLPKYSITSRSVTTEFNPIIGSEGIYRDNDKIEKYKKLLANNLNRKEYEKIKQQALKEDILIQDNGGFIAQASRQCVNARVQGGAASMSKLAMIKVFNNEELKKLGFRILLQIHDELIGECPEENAERAMEVLTDVMKHCAEPAVQVPFKCDGEITPCWYYNDYRDMINQEYSNYLSNFDKSEAFNKLKLNHEECTTEQLEKMLNEQIS